MELQSIFLSFSTSYPLFLKMVLSDLTFHIYHISTVYLKLYQIRLSFITLHSRCFHHLYWYAKTEDLYRKIMFMVLSGLYLN